MKIIAGQFKGKKLVSSNDYSIRPTTNRIKENIFNVLQDFCFNRNVLDLFSGSGNLGLEALSRGAERIVFVENAEKSIEIIRKNIGNIKIDLNKVRIIKQDALQFCEQTDSKFDLIFIDPPFDYPPLQKLINTIMQKGILQKDGVLVIEHEKTNPITSSSVDYLLFKEKKVGRSIISFIINRN